MLAEILSHEMNKYQPLPSPSNTGSQFKDDTLPKTHSRHANPFINLSIVMITPFMRGLNAYRYAPANLKIRHVEAPDHSRIAEHTLLPLGMGGLFGATFFGIQERCTLIGEKCPPPR